MTEVDPRLGEELDRLYESIEGAHLPPRLQRFDARTSARRTSLLRTRRVVIGVVALSAVAGVVFAGLVNHHVPSAIRQNAAAVPTPSPSASSSAAPSASPSPFASASPNPTQGWRPVSDPAGQFSFRVPADWQVHGPCVDKGQAPGDAPRDQVRVGPADLRGSPGTDPTTGATFPPGLSNCGGDFGNGVIVDSSANGGGRLATNSPGCSGPPPAAVVIAGVPGTRQVIDPHCAGYSSLVQYHFVVAQIQREYVVYFQRNAGDPDITGLFDQLMSQTWAFHA